MVAKINNAFYSELHDKWYEAYDHPIALLRKEQQIKNPWVLSEIQKAKNEIDLTILDIGCGAGFLTNFLAKHYSHIEGLDASASSLEVAKKHCQTKNVIYTEGDAYNLPQENESMDVVCAMDFLEHVEEPSKVVTEAARVLKPGGLFFFHTFNRNFLSWLIVIKFVEWLMPNTPKNLHVHHLFIKPEELDQMMKHVGLKSYSWKGLGPKFNLGFIRSIFARKVTDHFEFEIKKSLALGYIGVAIKE